MSLSDEKKEAWLNLIKNLYRSPLVEDVLSDPEEYFNKVTYKIETSNLDDSIFYLFNVLCSINPKHLTLLSELVKLYNYHQVFSSDVSKKIVFQQIESLQKKYEDKVLVFYSTELLPSKSEISSLQPMKELISSQSFNEEDYGKISFINSLKELMQRKTFRVYDFRILYADDERLVMSAFVYSSRVNSIHLQPKFDTPPGTEWRQIKIKFVSSTQVDIYINDVKKASAVDYSTIGMFDKKSQKENAKPTRAWAFLLILAKEHGKYNLRQFEYGSPQREKLKKYKIWLSEKLKEFFGITEDPFESSKKHDELSYEANFELYPENDVEQDYEALPIEDDKYADWEQEYEKKATVVYESEPSNNDDDDNE